MSNKPLISVVIPAYNHERFVGAAIESVLNQSCSDFELVIVDDGSTDNTAEVIKSYTDKRIHYYYQENQDAFNTINRGISLAKGRYISILNSDDIEVFNFGKHKGVPVKEVFEKEPGYYSWMMKGDFPLYTKKILTEIRLRSFNQK